MVERDGGRWRRTERAVVERFLDLIASGWGVYAAAGEVGIVGGKARTTVERSGLTAAYDGALQAQRRALLYADDPRLECACGGRKLIGHAACPTCRGRETVTRTKGQRLRNPNVVWLDCCGPPPHRRCEPRESGDPEQEYDDYCGALIGPKHVFQRQDATGRCETCQADLLRIRRKRVARAGVAS